MRLRRLFLVLQLWFVVGLLAAPCVRQATPSSSGGPWSWRSGRNECLALGRDTRTETARTDPTEGGSPSKHSGGDPPRAACDVGELSSRRGARRGIISATVCVVRERAQPHLRVNGAANAGGARA